MSGGGEEAAYLAALAERRSQAAEVGAVLNIGHRDAWALVGQFRSHPEQRRSPSLLEHCAAVLRERRDLLASNHLETLERAYARVGAAK